VTGKESDHAYTNSPEHEAQPGRRADAAHGWTYAALRALAALLAAGALLFGSTAIAYADAVSFFDKWVGHDRTMQLSPDGTGTLTLGDGALNTDQWGDLEAEPQR
jgi:hypothetical protein